MSELVNITGMSNQEFLAKYAKAGHIGLSGGITLIDRAIRRAERHLDDEKRWGRWSHVFVFQGQRADGHHWIIESDLQFVHKHISLGVQENRVTKYHDDKLYTWLAVIDLGLTEPQAKELVREALDLVANRTRYSIRELFGTLLALRHPGLRGKDNVLSRNNSLYCSAFVQHLIRKVGHDLAPGVDSKNTTPEDIARTPLARVTYLLDRPHLLEKTTTLAAKLRARVQARLKKKRT